MEYRFSAPLLMRLIVIGKEWPQRLRIAILKRTHLKFNLLPAAVFIAYAGIGQTEVLPEYYSEPGLNKTRAYISQHPTEHIDPFTGRVQLHFVDLYIPGNGGLDIKVQRSYTSGDGNYPTTRSASGMGWTMHFGRVIKGIGSLYRPICATGMDAADAKNAVLELPDGSRQVLYEASDTGSYPGVLFLTANRWKAVCSANGSGLIVTSPTGVRYDMTLQASGGSSLNPEGYWYATRITDRNNNYLTINYVQSGGDAYVSSVTSSDGRSVNFTYINVGTSDILLDSVLSNGSTFKYTYVATAAAGHYQLATVRRPGNTTWQFEYYGNRGSAAGSYSIRKVTYPEGGTIAYDYGWMTFSSSDPYTPVVVATSKTTSDGGAWTFSYLPGSSYDTTTVNAPDGTTIYKHFGYQAAASGTVWKIGLLLEKQIGTVQTETYTWDKQLVSYQNHYRPSAYNTKVDTESYVPIMASKTINRNGTLYSTTFSGFDKYGNPASISESSPGHSRAKSVTYYVDTTQWIINQIQNESISNAGSISRTFDSKGNLSSITRFGVYTSFGWTSAGDLASKTNARNFSISYSNYYRGTPRVETHPEGVSISRVVNGSGTISSETNGEGYTTSYLYDGLNRITQITSPVRNPTTISWGTSNKVVTRGNYQETITLDGFGRAIQVKKSDLSRAISILVNIGYNPLGRKIFESYPNSSQGSTITYDLLGRMTRFQHADSSAKVFTYSGSSTKVKNERLHETTYAYRAYGDPDEQELINITAPEGMVTSITRNGIGQITQVVQDSVTRTFGYSPKYFLESSYNPETGTTIFGRDAIGNMTSKQVGSSTAVTYVYDGLDRLVNITPPAGTSSVQISYNRNSETVLVNNGVAKRDYAYDPNGKMQSESLSIGGLDFAVGYNYDDNDQLYSIRYPSNKVVTYAPDALGRPTQVGPYITNVTFHPSGTPQQLIYANGVVTDMALNPRLLPENMYTRGAMAVHNFVYGYDSAGNLLSVNDSVDPSNNRSLSYDGADRLKTVNGPWGSGGISYNASGDIASQFFGGFSLTYGYDASRKLANVTGSKPYTFTYDSYGNVTNNGYSTFSYDALLNLRCVNCGASSQTQHEYDGNGMRVSSREAQGPLLYSLYAANGDLLMEYESTGSLLREYAYLNGKQISMRTTSGAALDSDGDGLPNQWELLYGLNPLNAADAPADSDGDGLTNAQEYSYRTHPRNADTDGDGISDGSEVASGRNPLLNEEALPAILTIINSLLLD